MSLNLETVRLNKGPFIHVYVDMDGDQIRASRLELSDSFKVSGATPHLLDWIDLYLNRKAPPLFLSQGTPFQKKVMDALSLIPFGKTLSYQKLATLCGVPNGARAIGNACGKNPFPFFVPCHRVIHSNGNLGGFAVDIEIKRRLLAFELPKEAPIPHPKP